MPHIGVYEDEQHELKQEWTPRALEDLSVLAAELVETDDLARTPDLELTNVGGGALTWAAQSSAG